MPSVSPFVTFNQVTLEKLEIGLRYIMSQYLLGAKIDLTELVTGELEVAVRGYLWSEKIDERTIQYPKDWKESFKERWFPKWMLKRYPVVYTVHEIKASVLYPNYRISVPDQEHLLVLQYTNWDKVVSY